MFTDIQKKQSDILTQISHECLMDPRLVFLNNRTLELLPTGVALYRKSVGEIYALEFEKRMPVRVSVYLSKQSQHVYRISFDRKTIYTSDQDLYNLSRLTTCDYDVLFPNRV